LPADDFERDPEEVLAGVYRRGYALRRRRRLIRVGSIVAAVALLAGIPAVLAVSEGGGGGRTTAVAGPGPTTTSVEETTTTTTTTVEPTTVAAPVVVPAPTTTLRPRSTTTTTKPCHNSYDQACGPFYWDRDPGPNQPLAVDATYSPSSPKAGDTVTFTVIASDADARPATPCRVEYDYGDGTREDPVVCSTPACLAMYGPWTPEPKPGRVERTYDHVYQQPGTYTVTFSYSSAAYCADTIDPYRSDGSRSVTVTIS